MILVQNITFGHTCRLVGHEQATLLGCFFGHTCSPKWTDPFNGYVSNFMLYCAVPFA